MLNTTPSECKQWLRDLLANGIALRRAIVLWGPPGISKSAIVAAVSLEDQRELIDLRLGQIPPSDLRGLPFIENGKTTYARPHFLPEGSGRFTLFLDEFNQCTPAQQAVARQLILDRRVGNHVIAPNTVIIAACNRACDHAAVFDMSAPEANRFLHFDIQPDLDSFINFALQQPDRFHPDILAFLQFRPALLHAYQHGDIAFPTPRSWEFASELHAAALPVSPAVGLGAAAEFDAFRKLQAQLPDCDAILHGDLSTAFPSEPSLRCAVVYQLVDRARSTSAILNAFNWLGSTADAEWVQLFLLRLAPRSEALGLRRHLALALQANPNLARCAARIQQLNLHSAPPMSDD